MVERLWVPSIHLFPARNWNCAIPGCPFTPWMTANTLGTSTPLRGGPGHGGFSFRSVVH